MVTAEMIAAVSAVLVALIAAFAPALSSRDGRKKALEEAELLAKLKESLGKSAEPVKDLEAVLAYRTGSWREGVDSSAYEWFLRCGMILAALTVASSIAITALMGDNFQSHVISLLRTVQWVSVTLMMLSFLAFGGLLVLMIALSIRRRLNDHRLGKVAKARG